VFTYSTAGTFFNINERLLQADLDLNFAAWKRHFYELSIRRDFQRIFGICCDFPAFAIFKGTIIVAAGEITRHNSLLNFYDIVSNLSYRQDAISHRVETFLSVNRLGTDGTIFFTNNTGSVHRPGKTPVAVKKGGSDFDWSGLGKITESVFLGERNRPDSRGWTQLATSYAVQLAAA